MQRVAQVAVALLVAMLLSTSAYADEPSIDLQNGSFVQEELGAASSSIASTSSEGVIELLPTCGLGATYICYAQAICVTDGVEGTFFDVYRDNAFVGRVCLTPQEAEAQQQVTPGLVLRAFRRLTWPQSDLTIEPPGGTTLVNFDTNFYTDNIAPARQSITLLGQDVQIEATPTTYTWLHGDGTTQATDVPGRAYPGLDITHDYQSVGTFAPRLDTTYSGRYRLNGGPWIAIPETLTVAGTPQTLQSVEARPTLVSY